MVRKKGKKTGLFSLADLPWEIVIQILLRLRFKEIVICKCLCKTLRDIILDPEFDKQLQDVYALIRPSNYSRRLSRILYLVDIEKEVNFMRKFSCHRCNNDNELGCVYCDAKIQLDSKLKLPLRNLEFNPKSATKKKKHRIKLAVNSFDQNYKIVNSCNGLLCLSDPSNNNPVLICNPVTGEFIKLPKTKVEVKKPRVFSFTFRSGLGFSSQYCKVYSGLGFSPVTSQYKVIKISRTSRAPYKMVAQVHRLGTRSWNHVGFALKSLVYNIDFPTYLNGALHWLCLTYWNSDLIASFDIETERFEWFPSPQLDFDSIDREMMSIGVLEGCLYLSDSSSSNNSIQRIVVWVMKDYGVKKSWTKMYSIAESGGGVWKLPDGLFQPIKCMNKGALLMFNHCESALIYYDPTKVGFRYFKVQGFESKFEVIAHTPSFISLREILRNKVRVFNIFGSCGDLKLPGERSTISLVEDFEELDFFEMDGIDDNDDFF